MPKLSNTVCSCSAVSSTCRSPNTVDESVHRGLSELLSKSDSKYNIQCFIMGIDQEVIKVKFLEIVRIVLYLYS